MTSPYDESGMAQRYSDHRHEGTSSPNLVMEEPAFLEVVGDVDGLAILDLGCGDADFGLTALRAGCRSYLGVDDSQAMLGRAQEKLARTEADLRRSTIEELESPDERFDLVVSRMALHYVEDLETILRKCHRWLTPAGRLVLTVVHPVLTSPRAPGTTGRKRTDWMVDDYFSPGPRLRRWLGSQVTWHHRTIEDHLTALRTTGFTLSDLRECAPASDHFSTPDDPELARRRRVPLFLLLAATKDQPDVAR